MQNFMLDWIESEFFFFFFLGWWLPNPFIEDSKECYFLYDRIVELFDFFLISKNCFEFILEKGNVSKMFLIYISFNFSCFFNFQFVFPFFFFKKKNLYLKFWICFFLGSCSIRNSTLKSSIFVVSILVQPWNEFNWMRILQAIYLFSHSLVNLSTELDVNNGYHSIRLKLKEINCYMLDWK